MNLGRERSSLRRGKDEDFLSCPCLLAAFGSQPFLFLNNFVFPSCMVSSESGCPFLKQPDSSLVSCTEEESRGKERLKLA